MSEFSLPQDGRTNKRYATYGSLQELASNIVEVWSNNSEVTHEVDILFSYAIAAVKSINM